MTPIIPPVRFEWLTLLMVSEVIAAGLQLEPTGRNPRHYTVSFEDLDDGLTDLLTASNGSCPIPTNDA